MFRRYYVILKIKMLLVVLTAFFSYAATASAAPDDPLSQTTVKGLLSKMASANRGLSYRGIFTYEYGGVLKTVKVAHTVRDGLEYEKLTYLDGRKQEIIRQGRPLDCQRAGDRLLRGLGVDLNGAGYMHLEDHYKFYIKGRNRIAGRSVIEIHIVPKDKYRYGYSLSIDEKTGLLMRSMLVAVANNNRVLERFQFVSVDLDVMLSDGDLTPSLDDHLVASTDSTPCLGRDTNHPPNLRQWRAAWLPPGFMLAGYQPKTKSAGEALVFSDGLAVFSVFVDPAEALILQEVEASRGATVAFATRKGIDNRDFAICVVGEIPSAVARQVAQSVTPLQ